MKKQSLSKNEKRILIILRSYNAGIRLGEHFHRHGWHMDIADSGLTALKILDLCCRYDLIATELDINDVSGLFLCAMAVNKTRTLVINHGRPELGRLARKLGIDIIIDASLIAYDRPLEPCGMISSVENMDSVININPNTERYTC